MGNSELHKVDTDVVAEAIINGTAVAVSDGSFKDSHGTTAWVVLQGVDNDVKACDGYPSDQSANRSELAGAYAIAMAAAAICAFREE